MSFMRFETSSLEAEAAFKESITSNSTLEMTVMLSCTCIWPNLAFLYSNNGSPVIKSKKNVLISLVLPSVRESSNG